MPEFTSQATAIPTIDRYLERYAEPEAISLPDQRLKQFDSVIVIPVYDESEQALQRFLEFDNGRHTLLIWVFNTPESAVGKPAHLRTCKVLQYFLSKLNSRKVSERCFLSQVNASLELLIVDRCSCPIPDKQGVGLARKIGADLALLLSYRQYLHSGQLIPWLYSTDADVILPQNYAMLAPPERAVAACVHPFAHRLENGYEQAMRQYEFSLHYYVDQLSYAGSPYAFHTIGSLLACTPLAYAQVRGFPKRAGAEDFYLLNKLAKVGRVETLADPVLQVAGRPSHRVPFGTGPALIKINAQAAQARPFQVYHPRIFTLLKAVLASVSNIENSIAQTSLPLFARRDTILQTQEQLAVIKVLDKLGWQKQSDHMRQLGTPEAKQSAFHTWFDAFLTLRFVHELRDQLYPNINLAELPVLLDEDAFSGACIDYIAWFKKLGISA